MSGWAETVSTSLAEKTSRRGLIGRMGRTAVAVGVVTAGFRMREPVAAASCGGGGCGSLGQCTGTVISCPGDSCPNGWQPGWSWTCCSQGHDFFRCQDCCDANNTYQATCEIVVGGC